MFSQSEVYIHSVKVATMTSESYVHLHFVKVTEHALTPTR